MQRESLESANTNTAVLESMVEAGKTLKSAHKHMDVDKVHDMMDDIAEQQDVAREISEAISNPVAFGQDVDEVRRENALPLSVANGIFLKDELERELEELQQEELDNELLGVPEVSNLPSIPTAEPAAKVPACPVPARPASKSCAPPTTSTSYHLFSYNRGQGR